MVLAPRENTPQCYNTMTKNPTKAVKAKSRGIRIGRNISFQPHQDAWLTSLLGEKGNLSAFIQGLVELARNGKVDTRDVMKGLPQMDVVTRAAHYLKAKEAAMLFEEDVFAAVGRALVRGQKAVRGRIFNESGPTFIADVCVESEKGELFASIICKSSPRADRLQLALAEAMIGQQKTGHPVITVVPYLIVDAAVNEVVGQFMTLGYALTTIAGIPEALKAVK
jgi:hypothetical protein